MAAESSSPGQPVSLRTYPTVRILDVPVHQVTTEQALAEVLRFMSEPRLHQLATVNPEFVMAAQQDRLFRQVLDEADLCLPDGVGLIWASRRLGRPLPERIAGSDFVYHIARLASEHGWRLFLLGAGPGVAEESALVFQSRFPGIKIAGTYAGTPDPDENEGILERINAANSEVLYVAYGAPRQDKWIYRNRDNLPSVRLAIGVGGSLDFVTGRAARAPDWLQKIGLEWLHRLYKEPWRWRRMLALPRFAVKVLVSDR
jgi:N-acetylglucosaminyldiphosphoundecaprenol N-acetyl-beta-D-mannosaminyltransferase